MFQASATRNPWDKPSASFKKAQYESPHSLHQHFSCSKKGKIFDQITQKEKKKKQSWLKYEWAQKNSGSISATNVNASNVGSTFGRARKALSQIICFNYIKKEHHPKNCSKPKRDISEE